MQARNIQLVKVNARVTLVVWILESIANVCIVILWVFIYGSTSFGTLTNSMVWYYLLISYTFLMNTSYNKNRIVDDGWKTVLLNSIIDPLNIDITRTLTQFLSTNKEYIRNNPTLNLQNRSNCDHSPSTPPPDNRGPNSSPSPTTSNGNDSNVFIIAKPELDIELVDIDHDVAIS